MDDRIRRNLETMRQADFNARCRDVNARLETEDLSPGDIAEALGLDFDFFASCLAVETARLTGQPVMVMPDVVKH